MELLAPAGSIKHLRIAVDAGADAVYLGGKFFSARQSAENFSEDELRAAVEFCHLFGVAVYVTVNTIVADKEFARLKEYLEFLAKIKIDAVIIQDLAVAKLIHDHSLPIEVHASTQMTVSDLEGVNFLAELGFSRVVLSRELSLKEIKQIAQNSPIELEVFIHGAICVSYSGQCLMSSIIGARSGNRGACAQPCRLPYELIDGSKRSLNPRNEKFIMSPKDMSSEKQILELRELGIASFKIEGRLKELDYVWRTVATYRDLLDGRIDAKTAGRNLAKSFNRGFTDAYWLGNVSKEMLTRYAPNRRGIPIGNLEWINKKSKIAGYSTGQQKSEGVLEYVACDGGTDYIRLPALGKVIWDKKTCRISYEREPMEKSILYWQENTRSNLSGEIKALENKIPLYVEVIAICGKPLLIRMTDDSNNSIEISHDFIVQKAQNRPTSKEMIYAQLNRLGNTIFHLAGLKVSDGNYMLPASVLNQLRNMAVNALMAQRLQKYENVRHKKYLKFSFTSIDNGSFNNKRKNKILVHARTKAEWLAALSAGADEIVYGGDSYNHEYYSKKDYEAFVETCRKNGVRCGIATPVITREAERKACDQLFDIIAMVNPDFVVLHSYGDFQRYKKHYLKQPFYIDTNLNVFNSKALEVWQMLGVECVILSSELNLRQLRNLGRKQKIRLGIFACGRSEMMITENCVVNAYLNDKPKDLCPGICIGQNYFLRDRLNKEFPLVNDQFCRMHVLNSDVTDMMPYLSKLSATGINTFKIDAGGISLSELEETIRLYKAILHGDLSPSKAISPYTDITRGHLFRGIT